MLCLDPDESYRLLAQGTNNEVDYTIEFNEG